jgi:hypothetical protein
MSMSRITQISLATSLVFSVWAGAALADVQVELDPSYQLLEPGETATLNGRVLDSEGEAMDDQQVNVEVIDGPHAGIEDVLFTDGEGAFSFSYVGSAAGLDLIRAEYVPELQSVVRPQAPGLQQENGAATAQVEWQPQELPAPDCNTVVASPFLIWPPNHKMRAVTLHGPDPVDGVEAEVTALYVHQDEPTNWRGDGNFAPDAEIGEDGQTVSVRAERSGLLDGRLYFVGFEASLPGGGECQGEALLGVPHDRGQGHLPQDSGERYDSVTGEHLTAED